jgi:hypothetical protein
MCRCAAGLPDWPLSGGSVSVVKKLILVLAAAGAGFALYKKRSASKPQQTLWAQATDRV